MTFVSLKLNVFSSVFDAKLLKLCCVLRIFSSNERRVVKHKSRVPRLIFVISRSPRVQDLPISTSSRPLTCFSSAKFKATQVKLLLFVVLCPPTFRIPLLNTECRSSPLIIAPTPAPSLNVVCGLPLRTSSQARPYSPWSKGGQIQPVVSPTQEGTFRFLERETPVTRGGRYNLGSTLSLLTIGPIVGSSSQRPSKQGGSRSLWIVVSPTALLTRLNLHFGNFRCVIYFLRNFLS